MIAVALIASGGTLVAAALLLRWLTGVALDELARADDWE
jgi:hypothetical protein